MSPPRRIDPSFLSNGAVQPEEGTDMEWLRRVDEAPDLTRRIMGRLGYMRAAPNAAARAKRRRAVHRAAGTLTLLVCGWIGLKFYEFGSWTRHPDDITMPAAVQSDFALQQERIDTAIRTIHRLASHEVRPLKTPEDGQKVKDWTTGEATGPGGSTGTGGAGTPMWLAPVHDIASFD